MAPPDLARDAPGPDVLQPVQAHACEPLGREADALLADGGDRRLDEVVHVHPPLQEHERLDPRLAARAPADRVPVGLLLLEQVALARPLEHALPGLVLGQAGELAGLLVHPPVEPDDRQLGELVGAADLEVERIVAGRDLEGAGAELRLDALVRDHRHAARDERDDHVLADEVPVALVVGMDGDRDVGEDRGRADGRDRHVPGAVHERVADVRERVVGILVLDLEVGERSQIVRAPVGHPGVAVDRAALVQVDEPANDGAVVARIHGEPLAAVVERGAEEAELLHDLAAVLLEPALRVLVEPLAAQIALRLPLLGQLAADRGPGREPAVVVPGLEERVEAARPVVADEGVLERELKAVADRQGAGDVGRRVHDHERLARRLGVGLVQALLFPDLLPACLDGLLVVPRLHGEDLKERQAAHRGRGRISDRRRNPACRGGSRRPSAVPDRGRPP